MADYAPYPATHTPPELHQSPYDSTYPSSHDSISSASAALGSVAGMPVPLGSSGGMNGAPGTGAEGENCAIM